MKNKQIEYLCASIDDDVVKADRQLMPVYTNFYNLAEQRAIENFLSKTDNVTYKKTGGYDQAERCIFCLYSIFIDYNSFECSPIKVLVLKWDGRYYQVTHRDVLGAILGLGIKREVIGDIIIEDDIAYVFVIESIAPFIIQNLMKIGSTSVVVTCCEIDEVEIKGPNIKSINAVIPSLRLDCITGVGFNMSRTKSIAMIKAGNVMVNWKVCTKPAFNIEPGDIITIRGKGRIRYRDMARKTKKGKLVIELDRYV